MTRQRLIELLPVMEHFANGGEVETRLRVGTICGWSLTDKPSWEEGFDFRIKPSLKLVPLEAEDWLMGGPWWERRIDGETGNRTHPALVLEVMTASIRSCGSIISFEAMADPQYQRRSGSDPDGKWEPCSKEAKE